jgi:hypothetical protein
MAEAVALASLVGTGISYMGGLQSAKAEGQAYEMRARMSEMEAKDFETQAQLEQVGTQFESARLRRKLDAAQATQRATVAASGLEFAGSPVQFIASDIEEQEMDALMLRFGGMSRQLGRERSAQMSRLNAGTLRAEGHNARAQGRLRAFSSLLTGVAGAGAGYYAMGGQYGRETFGIK